MLITDTEFDERVLAASMRRTIVLLFEVDGSEPCAEFLPAVEAAVAELDPEDVALVRIDAERSPNAVAQFGIALVPAVRVIRGQVLRAIADGVVDDAELRARIAEGMPSAAERAIARRDEALLRAYLAEDRTNVPVMVVLGQILLEDGRVEEAHAVLMPAGHHPVGGGLLDRARLTAYPAEDPELAALVRQLGEGDVDGAMAGMIELVKDAEQERHDNIARIVISEFAQRAPDDPWVVGWRQQLEDAL
jgi:thioredoxin-like negative regulator of GroEL